MPQNATCPKCALPFPVTEARHAFTVACPGCDTEMTVEFKTPAKPPEAGQPHYELVVTPGALVVATADPSKKKKGIYDDEAEEPKNRGGALVVVFLSTAFGMTVVLGGLGFTAWVLFGLIDTATVSFPNNRTPVANNSSSTGSNNKTNGPARVEPEAIGVGKEPHILGSIEHDPKFKTVGPEGAILIGVEARFEKFGSTDIVRGIRPIYRANGREEFGEQFGSSLNGSVTLKARPGYAVGGVTGKAGWWCNGFSLTFMRVKPNGTLDPRDSYESPWAGFNGQGEVTRVLSNGPPAVGIVGKIVGTKTTAFGILFKGQENFDPTAGRR
ncbi:MAG TPA: hypothetical protein VGE74_25990 [Gemmata sp.]